MFSFPRRASVVCAFVLATGTLYALPVLPDNKHAHVPTWEHTPGDPTKNHQHWNNLKLGQNHGDGSFYAVAAWDNYGTTTTYHDELLGNSTDFGHGFIDNRVLYWFDTAIDFAPPDMEFRDRVNDVFAEWVMLVHEAFDAQKSAHPGLALGFNFAEATGAQPTETHIAVRFGSMAPLTTAAWIFGSQILQFNTDFTWYTGAAAPGAGQRDFVTTARHEIGHAIGLDHTFIGAKTPGHSILGTGAAAAGERVAIDAGSIEGALALYTQPVPEPTTAVLMGLGLALFVRRR